MLEKKIIRIFSFTKKKQIDKYFNVPMSPCLKKNNQNIFIYGKKNKSINISMSPYPHPSKKQSEHFHLQKIKEKQIFNLSLSKYLKFLNSYYQ
jgi:hypothetical protein